MAYDVHFRRSGPFALFDIRGSSDAVGAWLMDRLPVLPARPNSKMSEGGVDICHIGRDHWLVRAPMKMEPSLSDTLQPATCPPDISIVLVSDTLTFFEITGADAGDVMAIACPLDLHPDRFGAQDVTFTEAFGLKALVQRCAGGFELAVEQSFAHMVETYLHRANA